LASSRTVASFGAVAKEDSLETSAGGGGDDDFYSAAAAAAFGFFAFSRSETVDAKGADC
jgi:hypothetical protein